MANFYMLKKLHLLKLTIHIDVLHTMTTKPKSSTLQTPAFPSEVIQATASSRLLSQAMCTKKTSPEKRCRSRHLFVEYLVGWLVATCFLGRPKKNLRYMSLGHISGEQTCQMDAK